MAATAEIIKGQFGYQEAWGRTQVTTVASGQTILAGTMGMVVAGKAYSAANALTTYSLLIPGADANGDVYVYANQGNVKIATLGGTSKTFGITVVYSSTLVTINVQLATDGGGLVTTTGIQLANALWAHSLASKYVTANYNGTGGSISTVTSATAVPEIYLAGVAEQTYAGFTEALVAQDINWLTTYGLPCIFDRGIFQFAPQSGHAPTAAMVGTQCGVYDNNTIRTPPAALDLLVQLRDVDPQTGIVYALI